MLKSGRVWAEFLANFTLNIYTHNAINAVTIDHTVKRIVADS